MKMFGGWVVASMLFGAQGKLHSVDCIRILALENSPYIPLLRAELEDLLLWDNRTSIIYSKPDPREGAGCWNAHIRAWRNVTAANCNHSLILEEDATFRRNLLKRDRRIDYFIGLNEPYDILQLGMWHNGVVAGNIPMLFPDLKKGYKKTVYTPYEKVPCMARTVGEPGSTHAYIISRRAALRWRPSWELTRKHGKHHIDQWMKRDSKHNNFVLLPSLAFQRFHSSANMHNIVSKKMEPTAVGNSKEHAILERTFFKKMPAYCWPRSRR